MRLALSLLLVLAACSTAPADPAALLTEWLDVVRRQQSVRFTVEIEVEGKDPRRTTYAGVRHVNTNGGATTQHDVTAHNENRYGVTDYRAVTLGNDTFLQHSRLTTPQGKTFVHLDLNATVWSGTYLSSLSMDERQHHPGNLFTDIDRKTLRLTERDGNRYVFNAGGIPHSGGYTQGDVRLVVELDDDDRVVEVEQTGPSPDGQQERRTAEYGQWGTAPDVLRPAAPIVAKPSEVVVEVGA